MGATELRFRDLHVAVLYVCIIVAYLVGERIWKIWNRNRGIVVYTHPPLNIRNICGISMMTAMNIALIISISLLSNQIVGVFFRVYPGARFLIENILVKLGGLFFGPLIGMFIGFATDLLTVIFTASVLNYGYFFGAIMSGFIGGVIHRVLKIRDPSKKTQSAIISACSLFALILEGIALYTNANETEIYSAKILNFDISLHWYVLFGICSAIILVCMGLLWYSTWALRNLHHPRHGVKATTKFFAKNHTLFMILMANCGIYMFVDMIALPLFDIKLSTLPYEHFLVGRVFTSIPFLIVFTFIINYIYKLHDTIKKLEVDQKPDALEKSDREKIIPRLMS